MRTLFKMQLLGESSSMGSSCLKSETLLLLGRIPLGDIPPALQHLQIPRSRHILYKCLEKLCWESGRPLLPEAQWYLDEWILGGWHGNGFHSWRQNVQLFLYLFLLTALSSSFLSSASFLLFYLSLHLMRRIFTSRRLSTPGHVWLLGNEAHWHFLQSEGRPPWHCSLGDAGPWQQGMARGPDWCAWTLRLNLTGSFSDLKEFTRRILLLLADSKCSLKLPVSCPSLLAQGQLGDANPYSLDKNRAAALPQILKAKGFENVLKLPNLHTPFGLLTLPPPKNKGRRRRRRTRKR